MEHVDRSEMMQMYRTSLFTRIVPTIKDIGLWGPRIQKAYADMGILGFADIDVEALERATRRSRWRWIGAEPRSQRSRRSAPSRRDAVAARRAASGAPQCASRGAPRPSGSR